MSRAIVVRAAVRLTPRMFIHQIKRHLRNRLVPHMVGPYQRLHDRRLRKTPTIDGQFSLDQDLLRLLHRIYRVSPDERRSALNGSFEFFGRRVDFGSIDQIDWGHRLAEERDHHLWRMKLNQLEALHSVFAEGADAEIRQAVELLALYDKARSFAAPDCFATVWSPYGASHRVLALLSGLSLLAKRSDVGPEVRGRAARAIEDLVRGDATFIAANVEHDLRNNHTERNLAALCLYGMAAGVSRRKSRRLDRDVEAIMSATILDDGMQVERSAMYQGLTVMSLHIFAKAEFLSSRTRATARSLAAKAEDAWLFLSHPDDQIALFNDSWIDETPSPRAVLDRERPALTELPSAGYGRRIAGEVEVLMDLGAIGPRWNPGHGHADFLSMEADVDGVRLLVDPGTSQYFTGEVRTFERSSASHNGPHFIGAEPVEYEGCFKVGRLASAERIPVRRSGEHRETLAGRLVTRDGSVLRLIVPSGEGMTVVDVWSTAVPGAVRLLFDGAWIAQVKSTGADLACGSRRTRIQVVTGALSNPVPTSWSRRFMQSEPATEVMLIPELQGEQQLAVWAIGDSVDAEVEHWVELARRLV